MPSFAPPYLRQKAMTRASASSFSSDHRPRSYLLRRPGISTAVASVMSNPAPDTDRWPRCIMCQSVALPFRAEYWPIGETTMRLPSSSPRILYLEKRADDMLSQRSPNTGANVFPYHLPTRPTTVSPAVRFSRLALLHEFAVLAF